jgi:hypothetical protein
MAIRTETTIMRIERHHWVNTYLGILDSVFFLSEEEQYHTIKILTSLLEAIKVPERGFPVLIPASVAVEAKSSFYSISLDARQKSAFVRHPRLIEGDDIMVSIDAWRDSLLNMLVTAYPDFQTEEKILAAKVFTELLVALGLPNRAAAYFPDDVVRAWNISPEAKLSYQND